MSERNIFKIEVKCLFIFKYNAVGRDFSIIAVIVIFRVMNKDSPFWRSKITDNQLGKAIKNVAACNFTKLKTEFHRYLFQPKFSLKTKLSVRNTSKVK